MLNSVNIFAGADTFIIIAKGHDIFAHLSSGQAPAVLPGKGVASAVIVAQRIANFVVSKTLSAISSKFIAPIGIAITVTVGALQICRRITLRRQGVCILLGDVTGIVILVDIGFVQERVILTDQLVDTVIGVGALGDDRTVPCPVI